MAKVNTTSLAEGTTNGNATGVSPFLVEIAQRLQRLSYREMNVFATKLANKCGEEGGDKENMVEALLALAEDLAPTEGGGADGFA